MRPKRLRVPGANATPKAVSGGEAAKPMDFAVTFDGVLEEKEGLIVYEEVRLADGD